VELKLIGLPVSGEVEKGADLDAMIAGAMSAAGIAPNRFDILVVAQKIVSKAEGRFVDLATVTPSERAKVIAAKSLKDPRLVEVILGESQEIMRAAPNVLIVRHRLGYVMANAGVDFSNVRRVPGEERVLLLPANPDASADALRKSLEQRVGASMGVIVSDSFGRAWRNGVVNVALGAAGVPALLDRRGELDLYGRPLQVTEVGFADAVAAAAGLVMGEAQEGRPLVLVRGLSWQAPEREGRALLRPIEQDLFR
jgi:coenzyme F420-0:L-glutamate ligase/coenzyme F420-1:gamma-L-glutamate ligase